MSPEERAFLAELEALRRNADEASQHLYAYLAIQRLAKQRRRIRERLERDSLFWMTAVSALFTSSLLAVGRVFDQRSEHNLDRLLKLARSTPAIFSRDALARRKRAGGPEPPWLPSYLRTAHVPTASNFRALKTRVKRMRRVYESKYRDLRHKVFAHSGAVAEDEINRLFARTNRREFQRLVIALTSIHDALWQLFFNGRKPVLRRLSYSATPPRGIDRSPRITTTLPHQRIAAQAERVLRCMSGLTKR